MLAMLVMTSAEAAPLSPVGHLRVFIEKDIVETYEAAHPWLRKAWEYMNRPGFELSVRRPTLGGGSVVIGGGSTEYGGAVRSVCSGGGGSSSPMSCISTGMEIHLDASTSAPVIVHEMAHVYTHNNGLVSSPAPLGVAHVYLDRLSLAARCHPNELVADLLTMTVLPDVRTSYWHSCNGGNAARTQEALAVVRSALRGEMPAWFGTAYGSSDPDLERFWSHVKDMTYDKYVVVHHLRNAFGGYCNNYATYRSAVGSNAVRNPWRDGGCVPQAPRNVVASAVGNGDLSVSWNAPDGDGGAPVLGYEIQWKSGSQDYDTSRQVRIRDPDDRVHLIEGLNSGTEYTVRVVAYNAQGDGALTGEVSATPSEADVTAPILRTATVAGSTLTLNWNEPLDTTSVPATSAFAVNVNGTQRGITGVAVAADVVSLSLGTAAKAGDAVTVGYTPPAGAGANPLRDVAENNAAALSDRGVANETVVEIVSIALTSDPGSDGVYTYGKRDGSTRETIEATVTFSENVTVTGTPGVDAGLRTGLALLSSPDGPHRLGYHSGSGTASLKFRATVEKGDSNPKGISIPAGEIELNGGTIRSGSGHDAVLAHEGLAAQPGHRVDGVPPTLASAVVNGNAVTLTFNEALDETKVPTPGDGFTLWSSPTTYEDGALGLSEMPVSGIAVRGTTVTLTLATPVASDALVQVSYTAPDGESSAAVTDAAGNEARNFYMRSIDNVSPGPGAAHVTAIALASSPGPYGAYGIGDAIDVRVTYSESVTVDTANGTPTLIIDIGNVLRLAPYSAGSGTQELTFRYTVREGNADTDGVSIPPGGIHLNGGMIVASSSGAAAATRTPELAAQSGHLVETQRPTLSSATVDGDALTLTFSEALDGDSEPPASSFAVTVVGSARTVDAVAVSGSTVTLTLSSAVVSGETVTVGYTVPADASVPRVRNTLGNDATAFSGRGVTNNTPASTDATLSSLTLDGAALSPSFKSATERYAANVAHSVSSVTVTAEPNDGNANVGFTPATDADAGAPGHQVALSVGDNVIGVKVTAADVQTTRTYTVTVTRATAPSGPLTGFTLFDNANGGADVQALSGDATLEPLSSDRLNIRAEVTAGATVGSVHLELSGAQTSSRTEGIAPYALFGDKGGQAFPAGAYRVRATAYSERDLGGTVLQTLEVAFTVAAAPDVPAPSGPLTGFTLFDNANGGADVQALSGDATLEPLSSDRLNIRAEVTAGATVGSVRLELSGAQTSSRTEGIAPYALFGDKGGQAFPAGAYRVRATAYSERDLGGTVLQTLEVAFTVAAAPDVPAPSGPLTGFTLFDNANGGADVRTLSEGTELEALSSDRLNIRAEVAADATLGSVRLEMTGAQASSRTEGIAPYALFGDKGGQAFPAGAYRIRATAYPERGLGGTALGTLEVAFTVAVPVTETRANAPPTGVPVISGTARVGETLTASASGIADADGLTGAVFAWQWVANDGSADADIGGATGASYTLGSAEAGRSIKVRATFTDDAGTEEALVSEATAEVAAALTAMFESVPEAHTGSESFTVRIAFSEAVAIEPTAFREHGADVTGGSAANARRVDGRSDLWELTIAPASDAAVTIVVPADRACDTAGAICTGDGGRLSNRLEETVAGPGASVVSIAAGTSPVTEGNAAVFTLSRSGAATEALTVAVVVTESGVVLDGAPPSSVTFQAGARTAELAVATEDDEAAEAGGTVTAAIADGDGYKVDAGAASDAVAVEDDDAAPVIATTSPISVPESRTAVATLAATDADTAAEDLSWTIAGGADADAFTLTPAGALSFEAAKDFEAPDDANTDRDYEVTVRVSDGANAAEAPLTVRLADVDEIAPSLSSATVNGAALTLAWDEALDESSVPGASAFTVQVDGAARGVDSLLLSGSAATLTLVSPAAAGQTVTVGYTPPAGAGTNPIRDVAGNPAAGFSGRTAANETPANTPPTGLPVVSGTARVGQTLTASADGIADADGLTGATFTWQWLSNDGTADADIEGATAASYTLTSAEAGRSVKVRVTFTDDGGTEESLVSEATAVAAPPPEVSIAAAASPVTEGGDAVFTLRRTGDAAAALTVTVTVAEDGAVLNGAAPTAVTFRANATEARLGVPTLDDDVAEADARVTVAVASGSGYRVATGAGSADIDVLDNDRGAASVTILWSADMTVVDFGGGAVGATSPDRFSNIAGSGDLQAKWLWHDAAGRSLHLALSAGLGDVEEVTLHLDDFALAFPEESSGNSSFDWDGVDLDWSDGQTVAVRLTRKGGVDASTAGPGVSAADAQVREAAGALLRFRVTLDAPRTTAVSVRYATSDGTAAAGSDYEAASGALRFAPGETEKTIEIRVLEDAHDEGAETMALKLSHPFGARLEDAEATGTIVNSDPLPKAWLARFGRTVADHVIDAVGRRLTGARREGLDITIAGQHVGSERADAFDETQEPAWENAGLPHGVHGGEEARVGLEALSGWMRGGGADGGTPGESLFEGNAAAGGSRSVTGRELLTTSRFLYAGEAAAGGFMTFWGRGAHSRFDGRDDDEGLALRGEVTTGTLGADYEGERWLTGLALSHSVGEGTFSMEGAGDGEITSSLTGLYPYLRYEVSERLSVWSVLGHGRGTLSLTEEDGAPIETGIGMTMGAAGARGELLSAKEGGGLALALKTDALLVRTTSEATEGLLAAEADVSRLRIGLEGSWAFELDGGGSLTPSFEAGLRHDGGDAETGLGVELGAGLGYADPESGVTADVSARTLVAHEESGFEEWGASGSLGYDPDPSSEIGPSMNLSLSRGATSGGADALWRRETMAGIAANDDYAPGGGLEAEFGYGFSVLDGRAVGTPHAGVLLSDRGEALRLGYGLGFGRSSKLNLEGEFREDGRELRLGYRYSLGRAFDLNLEGARRESANDPANDRAPEHAIGLRLGVRW